MASKSIIKDGSIVQVKKKVWECYSTPKYTKENAPPWMKNHSGRGTVIYQHTKDSYGIKWEFTGQSIILNKTEFKLVK